MDHNEILVAIVDLKASIGVISGEAGREMTNESTYEMCCWVRRGAYFVSAASPRKSVLSQFILC